MLPLRVKRLILPSILMAGFGAFFASGAHDFFSWQFLSQHYTAIKGFAVDKVYEFLIKQPYLNSFFIEIGGEIRSTSLKSNDQPWRAGIINPIQQPLCEHLHENQRLALELTHSLRPSK